MDLTPKQIYEDFKEDRINRTTAYNLLISLIENSENENIRVDSIINLDKIGLINDNLYTFLEDLLISDSNTKIRSEAAKFLESRFLEKAINPLKWAIEHETDFKCKIAIIQSLAKISHSESKMILINQIKKIMKVKYLNKVRKIENKKYRHLLKKFIKTKKITNFTHSELSEILINYLAIVNLINQYPNVYYELDSQKGVIIEIDLSDYMEYEVKGTPFGWKNNIKSISEVFGLNYLKSIKKIDLSNNLVENIKNLVNFKNLTHLILINNRISEIENLNYLKRLPNLRFLDLRGNEFVKEINPNEFDSNIKVLLKDDYLKIK